MLSETIVNMDGYKPGEPFDFRIQMFWQQFLYVVKLLVAKGTPAGCVIRNTRTTIWNMSSLDVVWPQLEHTSFFCLDWE